MDEEKIEPLKISMKDRIKCVCGAIRNKDRVDCPVCYTIQLDEKVKKAKFKANEAKKHAKLKKHAIKM